MALIIVQQRLKESPNSINIERYSFIFIFFVFLTKTKLRIKPNYIFFYIIFFCIIKNIVLRGL